MPTSSDLESAKRKFETACRAIDQRVHETEEKIVRAAYMAALAGNSAERDRLLSPQHLGRVKEAAEAAKIEAWVRAGVEIGMDEDKLRQQAPGILGKGRQ